MDRKNEINDIENIITHSKEFKNIEENASFDYIKLIYMFKNSHNLNFFRFIPKANQANKKDFLEFATELKGLEKSYNLMNYLFGISIFYFSIILDARPKYFGVKTIMKFLGISSYILYLNLLNQIDYFKIMREIYFDDIEILKEKIEKEKNGMTNEVIKNKIK